MSAPTVSVVMTVYNGEPWLVEAVDSVLSQRFEDLELIVVDDGSSDGTPEILRRRADPRLTVVQQGQTGQTPALNRALRLARAPLVARMDADDVALPDRLARQVAFLGAHPSVGLLGTGCHEISPSGEVLSTLVPPVDDRTIRRTLIRRNPFVHSSVMFRRTALHAAGPYDEGFVVAQDYDLWLRMSRVTALANLPEPLVLRRRAPGQLSSARDTTRIRDEVVAKMRALRRRTYPPWCAVYLGKPLCALMLPPTFRHAFRRTVLHRSAPPGAGRRP
ncbi:MAG TPA: glycosyltransferase [Candidatus Binatia bacterium]|nr:glycosyltransferase [Candidatus Binatia bacterium]